MKLVEAQEPIGAVVRTSAQTGLDTGVLRRMLAEHGVLVFPDQDMDDDAFVGFLRRFGRLAFTAGETPLPGQPDLNEVSNVARATPPRSNFHVDTAYVSRPPAYTALRAVRVPDRGGHTVFTNQYRAAETLPDVLRARIEGRTMLHQATGVDDPSTALHPLIRPHPLTGRAALYLDAPGRCGPITGLEPEESAALVAGLIAHSTAPDNCYRHRWSPGDVVIWDNGAVMHRADHEGATGDRVLHRGMVAGYTQAA